MHFLPNSAGTPQHHMHICLRSGGPVALCIMYQGGRRPQPPPSPPTLPPIDGWVAVGNCTALKSASWRQARPHSNSHTFYAYTRGVGVFGGRVSPSHHNIVHLCVHKYDVHHHQCRNELRRGMEGGWMACMWAKRTARHISVRLASSHTNSQGLAVY